MRWILTAWSIAAFLAVASGWCQNPPGAASNAAPAAAASDPAKPGYDKAMYILWSGGNRAEAYRIFEELGNRYPQSPYPLIGLAEIAYLSWADTRQGSMQSAIELLARAQKINKDIADIYAIYARAFTTAESPEQAIYNADIAYRLAPTNAEVLFAAGQSRLAARQYAQAVKFYTDAVAAQKVPYRKALYLTWLAKAEQDRRPAELNQAEKALLSAIDLDRSRRNVQLYADFLLYQKGDYEKATDYAAQAKAIQDNPMSTFNMALSHYTRWADHYLHNGKHATPRKGRPIPPPTIPELRKFAQESGLSFEQVFVSSAGFPGIAYNTEALFKAGLVTNVEVKSGSCACTALHEAARSDNVGLARFLLSKNANPNAVNDHGETPLINALQTESWNTARSLLENGARVNVATRRGSMPLHIAYNNGDSNPEMVKLLLDRKADVNAPMSHGLTVLDDAAMRRDTAMVRLFLKYGADLERRDQNGMTILQKSLFMPGATKLLLDVGADPWAVNEKEMKSLQPTVYPGGGDESTKKFEAQKKELLALILDAQKKKPKPNARAK